MSAGENVTVTNTVILFDCYHYCHYLFVLSVSMRMHNKQTFLYILVCTVIVGHEIHRTATSEVIQKWWQCLRYQGVYMYMYVYMYQCVFI